MDNIFVIWLSSFKTIFFLTKSKRFLKKLETIILEKKTKTKSTGGHYANSS
jgi:hypothetical protein